MAYKGGTKREALEKKSSTLYTILTIFVFTAPVTVFGILSYMAWMSISNGTPGIFAAIIFLFRYSWSVMLVAVVLFAYTIRAIIQMHNWRLKAKASDGDILKVKGEI